eukprot:4366538-Alexandrium_andersonii.AAC.1
MRKESLTLRCWPWTPGEWLRIEDRCIFYRRAHYVSTGARLLQNRNDKLRVASYTCQVTAVASRTPLAAPTIWPQRLLRRRSSTNLAADSEFGDTGRWGIEWSQLYTAVACRKDCEDCTTIASVVLQGA